MILYDSDSINAYLEKHAKNLLTTAIDELNDRHGKELREFYEQKAKEKAQLQKDNATQEQLAAHEEKWSKQYSGLVNKTYNEEKTRTDAQAQEGAERRKVNNVIHEAQANSGWLEKS